MTTTYRETTRPRQLLRERHEDVLACVQGLTRARAAGDPRRVEWWGRQLGAHVPRLVDALTAQAERDG